jgi:hypothetical protein
MSRLAELEARRAALIARCEQQRAELGVRLAELTPGVVLRDAAAEVGSRAAAHPLAWIAALAGVVFLGRAREVLTVVVWMRSALAVATRATHLLRAVANRRAARKASRS